MACPPDAERLDDDFLRARFFGLRTGHGIGAHGGSSAMHGIANIDHTNFGIDRTARLDDPCLYFSEFLSLVSRTPIPII